MKIKVLFFIVGLFSILSVFAGNAKVKFGKIDVDDLKMQVYEKDSSASAVVLYDWGESEITYDQQTGWILVFNRHQRIKVLKKDGVNYGDFKISLHKGSGDGEIFSGFKAVTFNLENGKIEKDELTYKDVHTEDVNKYWERKIFTMSNVKVGSIIEVKYTINCKKYFRNMRPWKFQMDIPVKYSEYEVVIPEYFNFRKFALGFEDYTLSEETSAPASIQLTDKNRSSGSGFTAAPRTTVDYETVTYQNSIYHWIIEDVPSFVKEAYLSTEDNYIQQVQFELQSVKFPNSKFYSYAESWELINEKLTEDNDFGKIVFGSNNFLMEEVTPLIQNTKTDSEKLTAIYEYVRDNYKFNDRNSIYSQELRKIQKDKSGNVAEINFLLAAMLSNAGFRVKPVVLSTRANGLFLFPTVTGFNYVIVQCELEGKKVLLDATDKNCGVNQIPFKCLNGSGLVVGGSKPEWIELQEFVGLSTTQLSSQFEIKEDGSFIGQVQVDYDDYPALMMREKVNKFSSLEKYLEDYAENHSDWEIEDCSFDNIKNTNEKVVQTLKLTIKNASVCGGDRIYFSPIILNSEKTNPFTLKERKYPVDFGHTFIEKQSYTLTFPAGYVVEEMPKPAIVTLSENKARFTINFRVENNVIQVLNTIEINTPVFLPSDYELLKSMYNKIIEKHSEQIILKKI